MKKIALSALLALTFGHTAFATVTMEISSGSFNYTIPDQQAGPASCGTGANVNVCTEPDVNPAAGTVTFFDSNLNGWDISVATGRTHSSSNNPFGLDLASLTATCDGGGDGCTSSPLVIALSDTGFTGPLALTNDFTATNVLVGTGDGVAEQYAYFDNANLLNLGTISSFPVGTVGVNGCRVEFTTGGVNAGSCSMGTSGALYSETLFDIFQAEYTGDCATDTANSGACSVSFSTDGNITGTPEPASVALLGGIVFLTVSKIRRKMRKA
jgi:hypothetical protein